MPNTTWHMQCTRARGSGCCVSCWTQLPYAVPHALYRAHLEEFDISLLRGKQHRMFQQQQEAQHQSVAAGGGGGGGWGAAAWRLQQALRLLQQTVQGRGQVASLRGSREYKWGE